MREPSAFSNHMQRFVGSMPGFPPIPTLPFLADFYHRRLDYGSIAPPPPPPPPSSFYHPMIQISPAVLNAMPILRSYSSPSSSTTTTLVNSHSSPSAFVPLIPVVRQHSLDISPPSSSLSSTPALSNNTNFSIRRSSDEDDLEVDIETLPSPSKTSMKI